jgi:hypothetical protein
VLHVAWPLSMRTEDAEYNASLALPLSFSSVVETNACTQVVVLYYGLRKNMVLY